MILPKTDNHRMSSNQPAYRLPRAFVSWLVGFPLRGEQRRQRRALAQLDDRLLADIGLTPDLIRPEKSPPHWYR